MVGRVTEPIITINGIHLSEAHAITVRVALQNFEAMLCEQGEPGIGIEALYVKRVREITRIILSDA